MRQPRLSSPALQRLRLRGIQGSMAKAESRPALPSVTLAAPAPIPRFDAGRAQLAQTAAPIAAPLRQRRASLAAAVEPALEAPAPSSPALGPAAPAPTLVQAVLDEVRSALADGPAKRAPRPSPQALRAPEPAPPPASPAASAPAARRDEAPILATKAQSAPTPELPAPAPSAAPQGRASVRREESTVLAPAPAAAAPAASLPPAPPPAPVIKVHIGRVELRAAAPSPAAPAKPLPKLSLSDFLKQQ